LISLRRGADAKSVDDYENNFKIWDPLAFLIKKEKVECIHEPDEAIRYYYFA